MVLNSDKSVNSNIFKRNLGIIPTLFQQSFESIKVHIHNKRQVHSII